MDKTQSNGKETDQGIEAGAYGEIVRSVANHLRQQGFASVKAEIEGFSRPARIRWEEGDEGVIPDIIGEHNGSIYVFEVELSDQVDARAVEDRWRLLSVHARRHNGKFYLVTPETKAGYLQQVAKDLNIKPEFLKLSGIE